MKTHFISKLMILAVFALSVGCVKKDSGFCPEPHEDMQWVYITDSNGVMTQTSCVLCDTSVTPEDYGSWANENAQEATPCLYVYPEEPRNWDSKSDCLEMACQEDPNVNDGVKQSHGAWRVIKDILGDPSAALGDPEQNHMMIGSFQTPEVQTEISETDARPISATQK